MEQLQTCRLNVMNITSVSSFAHIRGGVNRGCKDVYFVRAIGRNENLEREVLEMDAQLQAAEAEGKGFYRRIQKLPGQMSYEDSVFYAGCCDEWVQEGRKKVRTKVKAKPGLGELLARSCEMAEKLYLEDNPMASSSMRKNFIVKLLYWFDSIFEEQTFGNSGNILRKLVVCNVVKKQEYLFCYLAALTGCDVLLLQMEGDISCSEKWKKLSASFVLGEFSKKELPPCRKYERVPKYPEMPGNRTMSECREDSGVSGVLAANLSSEITQHQPQTQSGMVRVVIPEHRRSSAKGGNVTEHPSRGQGGNTAGSASRSQGGSMVGSASRSQGGSIVGSASRSQNGAAATGSVLRVEKSYEELARLASSVVMIALHDRSGEVIGTGSGIMIGRKGYILTNNHVANGGCYYSVKIEEDDQVYRTDEVIKYNPVLDLAVIRIQRELCPLPIYRGSQKLVRGQRVVAIGSPLGLFNSVSDGIISGFRKVDNVDMIQFTAPTSHGSSGGAVLNLYGEVIGISTAGFDAGQNLNLAVGYEYIQTFVQGFV